MSDLDITWRGKRFTIAATNYVENGNTCLVLLGKDGVIEAKPTVNLAKLPPHLVFIKDWSENKGIAEILIKADLIRHTGKTIRIGANEVRQYVLTPEFGSALGISVPERESAVLDIDVNADQTTEPTPQPPADKLNVPELVEGLEASGLNVHVIDEDTKFPDLQQEKLEEDARDIEEEQKKTAPPTE